MIPFIFFVSMGWLACVPLAFADEGSPRTPFSDRAVLRAGQVVQGDYFAFGPHVAISGIVNGDLYAAGGEVLVDGTVNGDVIVAGAKVMVSGTVARGCENRRRAGHHHRDHRQERHGRRRGHPCDGDGEGPGEPACRRRQCATRGAYRPGRQGRRGQCDVIRRDRTRSGGGVWLSASHVQGRGRRQAPILE